MKTLFSIDHGQPSKVNSLIKYKMSPIQQSQNLQVLGAFCFYNASMVLRVAHIVPANLKASDKFYLNLYVDWGKYTKIYTLEWVAETMAAAAKVAKNQ